jgi:hypothetical protein
MNKTSQKTINKCYTYLKEIRTRVQAGASFSYGAIAAAVKCTPDYFKFAKELGYIIDGASGRMRFDNEVTEAMAIEVLKAYNARSKKQMAEKAGRTETVKEVKVAAGYTDLLTDDQLIEELKRRGYTGKIIKSTAYEF